MKKILLAGLAAGLMTFCAAQAQATPYADWQISHSYMADNQVWIGVGDPTTPLWETLVQSWSWTSSGSVDISGGEQYLYGHTWYLKAQDFVWRDGGSIVNFQIRTDDGNTYTSSDHPWFSENTPPVYAYIEMPGGNSAVPEPATMLLFGTGIAGLAAVGRRKAQK